MTLSTEDMILIEQRIANAAKSHAAAYMFLVFLGGFGAHRFYVGKPLSGAIMLVATLAGISLSAVGVGVLFLLGTGFWALVDAFLIPRLILAHKDVLRAKLSADSKRTRELSLSSAVGAFSSELENA